MKGKWSGYVIVLLLIFILSFSLCGCGEDADAEKEAEVQQPADTGETDTSEEVNLLAPTVTYLESLSEIGDISEGLQLWYDVCSKIDSPSFYKLDDSFAEEGMTVYLFCQLSDAKVPVKVSNSMSQTYLDIMTVVGTDDEKVEPRKVLAIVQADKTLDNMQRNKVNGHNMESYLSWNLEDITVGHVDWSCLLNTADGDLPEQVLAEVNGLFEPSKSFGTMGIANPNGLHCFMTSTYDSIDEMDFKQFLRHFPLESDFEDGEIEALEASDAWKKIWGEFTINDIPTPTHHYTEDDINRVLEFYAGIEISVLDTKDTVHVGDTYYNFTSDFGPGSFECESGVKSGKTVTLLSGNQIGTDGKTVKTEVVLEEKNGRYLIKSRREVPAE